MNFLLLFQIARTHLVARVKQSLVAALGVTFGIGTFIVLMSFMTGLNGLLDGLILNRTPHVRLFNEVKASEVQPLQLAAPQGLRVVHNIRPTRNQERIHNALAIIDYLRGRDDVRGVAPQLRVQAFYLAGATELNGLINGVDVLEEARLFKLEDYVVDGDLRDLANNDNGILLGAGVAEKMSVQVGDRVQISTVQGSILALKVIGLFQSGLAEIDNVQSYTNLKAAQRLRGVGGHYVTDINIKLNDMERAPAVAQKLEQQFKLSAIDIKEANAQFDTGTSIRNLITYAVSITLLIVAGFGIYNILNMLIYEKMNDIAILKATGFAGSDVQWIFIMQALIIGLIGGLMGLGIGYGLSVLISQTPFETEALPTVKTFPVNFNPLYYIIGIVFAMVSTFLAGYLPARRAKRIDPVEIIRGA